MTTLQTLQADLERVQEKIREVIGTGAQYSIAGSHSATQQTIEALRKEEGRIRGQIRIFKGRRRRSAASSG